MIRTLKGERRAKPSLHVLGQLKLGLSMHSQGCRFSDFKILTLPRATTNTLKA